MLKMIRKRMNGEKGFTLVELLVVVIIIAILSAIAIPTFLGQRSKAQDSASRSLIRNAAAAVESYYADGQTYAGATVAALKAIEPSIDWKLVAATGAYNAPTDKTKTNSVDFFPASASVMELGTVSDSGQTFGMKMDKVNGNLYYKGSTSSAASW